MNGPDKALWTAITEGRGIGAVRDALQAGGNRELKDPIANLRPILHVALETGKLKEGELLLRYGANPDAAAHDGAPIVAHLAAEGDKHIDAVMLLKKFNANLRVADMARALLKGQSVLQHSIMRDGYKVAALFQEAGEDVNAPSKMAFGLFGMTALGYVVSTSDMLPKRNWEAQAVYLIKNLGADRSLPCWGGGDFTPAEMAKNAGHRQFAKLLDPAMPLNKIPNYKTFLPGSGIPRSIPLAIPRKPGLN